MDLLASLHLDGELPEQQTRISHLGETLAKDTNLKLGFNACCACAKINPSVECRACRRVKYCSTECRDKDAQLSSNAVMEEDQAMGHSSVVCALLRLCQADENAEDPDSTVDEASQDRVQSEHESYPATLANVLLDGPCFKVMLARCMEKELVIHVIGASVDAELWGGSPENLYTVWAAYADALQELAEKNRLKTIRLCFIGPDCPKKQVAAERSIPFSRKGGSSCQLIISTHKNTYSRKLFQKDSPLFKPDVVCFFNPGFTCPDYDWSETLKCLDYGTSFIITTNTEMEGIGDIQFLLEHKLLPSLPPIAAEIMERNDLVVDEESSEVVFGENPFAGNRVRQSGTMANDLFVKNRWLLAGVFGKPMAVFKQAARESSGDDERPTKRSKKEQSSKRSNPALI